MCGRANPTAAQYSRRAGKAPKTAGHILNMYAGYLCLLTICAMVPGHSLARSSLDALADAACPACSARALPWLRSYVLGSAQLGQLRPLPQLSFASLRLTTLSPQSRRDSASLARQLAENPGRVAARVRHQLRARLHADGYLYLRHGISRNPKHVCRESQLLSTLLEFLYTVLVQDQQLGSPCSSLLRIHQGSERQGALPIDLQGCSLD